MDLLNPPKPKVPIKKGDRVTVHYIGKLEDEYIFDATDNKPPIKFIAGGDEVLPAISEAVIGMSKNDDKSIEVEPEQGYGPVNPELFAEIAKDQLPGDAVVEVGESFKLVMNDGQAVEAFIAEVRDDTVVIDANHPLAGQKLFFKIGIVDVEPAETVTDKYKIW